MMLHNDGLSKASPQPAIAAFYASTAHASFVHAGHAVPSDCFPLLLMFRFDNTRCHVQCTKPYFQVECDFVSINAELFDVQPCLQISRSIEIVRNLKRAACGDICVSTLPFDVVSQLHVPCGTETSFV